MAVTLKWIKMIVTMEVSVKKSAETATLKRSLRRNQRKRTVITSPQVHLLDLASNLEQVSQVHCCCCCCCFVCVCDAWKFMIMVNPFIPKSDQLQFSLLVSHQRYIIQYGEFGNIFYLGTARLDRHWLNLYYELGSEWVIRGICLAEDSLGGYLIGAHFVGIAVLVMRKAFVWGLVW